MLGSASSMYWKICNWVISELYTGSCEKVCRSSFGWGFSEILTQYTTKKSTQIYLEHSSLQYKRVHNNSLHNITAIQLIYFLDLYISMSCWYSTGSQGVSTDSMWQWLYGLVVQTLWGGGTDFMVWWLYGLVVQILWGSDSMGWWYRLYGLVVQILWGGGSSSGYGSGLLIRVKTSALLSAWARLPPLLLQRACIMADSAL